MAIGNDNQKLKAFIALLIGVFFSVIISEIILQVLDFPSRPISGWLNCNKKHPEECNYMGFRGREIAYSDDDFVVILLGDSELYAPRIPFEQRPENRLEHFLQNYRDNVKVFTIADMGYGQDQQYLSLQKYFEKHRADLVLQMFTVRNDIEDNIFPVSGFHNTMKPTFWLDNSELQGPSTGWLEHVGPRLKLALLWSRYVGQPPGEASLEKWLKEILPPSYHGVTHYEGEIDHSWQEMWDSNPEGGFFKSLKFEKAGHAGTELTPRSELRRYGISLTRKLFSRIKQLTEANQAHLIFFKEERPWELQPADNEKVYYLNGKYYKLSLRQHHETVKDLFDGFEHYRIPLNMDNNTVSLEDEHLNQQAIDKIMKELSLIISKKEYFGENRPLKNIQKIK